MTHTCIIYIHTTYHMHTVYDRVVIAIKLIINFQADGLVAEVHAICARYHSNIHLRTLDLTSRR